VRNADDVEMSKPSAGFNSTEPSASRFKGMIIACSFARIQSSSREFISMAVTSEKGTGRGSADGLKSPELWL
jgi:MFS-type transporter involved in bile tolerance (Atg22 family)